MKTSRWIPFAEQELILSKNVACFCFVFCFASFVIPLGTCMHIFTPLSLQLSLTIETIIHLITYINIIVTFPVTNCLIIHAIIYLVHLYKVISLFVHTCLTISAIEPFDACTHIAVHLVNTCSSILTGRLFTIIYILNRIIQLYL